MRVLVVGSGGREHALAWKLAQSPLLTGLYAAPGNPGTAAIARNVAIAADDVAALVAFALDGRIDLVVPGPEAPLMAGLADACAAAGIACCGPGRDAARLEGSKAFAKELADEAGIPTAAWERFVDADAARAFVRRRGAPIVVKADGLAAGKGVTVAATVAEAEAAIADCLEDRALGTAGASIVIEECLTGEELSVFALCDGTDAVFLGAAQDHKRVGEGDTGPNTGGMGAVSPPPHGTPAVVDAVMAQVVAPALATLARRGMPYRGVLYVGLMLTAAGPKLIEFNARFGDPECQVLLPRLRSDLLPALVAACRGGVSGLDLAWHPDAVVGVVVAANGYPGKPATGGAVGGLERAAQTGATVFHAATAMRDGTLRAAGGRVLTVCGAGADLAAARDAAYAAIDRIEWAEGFCRRDIGLRSLGLAKGRA